MTQRSVPASRATQSEPARICQPTVSATATTMRLTPIVMWIHLGRRAEESWAPTFMGPFYGPRVGWLTDGKQEGFPFALVLGTVLGWAYSTRAAPRRLDSEV